MHGTALYRTVRVLTYGTVFVASVGTLQASAGIHLLFFIDKVPVTYCKVYRSDSHN